MGTETIRFQPDVLARTEQIFPWMIDLRRWLHQHPELAFEEVKTARRIVAELGQLGIPTEYGGPGGGVIGRIGSDSSAPTIGLRADMDALPGDEMTGLSFASVNKGRMHACGHDAHMTMVLGAAAMLSADPPSGNVVFVIQPAEERGAGARTMIDAGALEGVDVIFAGHVSHQYRTGHFMVAPGVRTAQSDGFLIRVCGQGGHGARPHEAVDAAVIASLLIIAFQTLVSREINPLHPSVVTVGKVRAGSAGNVIAAEALLEGSIRTTVPEVRQHIHEGLKRMTEASAMLHNASIQLDIKEGNPPVVNTERETAIARRAAERLVGKDAVRDSRYPSLGSEDFAHYLFRVPGCYVRIGARRPGWDPVPLHSPAFNIDEEAMRYGAAFFDAVVREAIREYSTRGSNEI